MRKVLKHNMELDQNDKDWVQKELQTPMDSLAKLIDDAGMMSGAIKDITSHLMGRLRDLRNGRTSGNQ